MKAIELLYGQKKREITESQNDRIELKNMNKTENNITETINNNTTSTTRSSSTTRFIEGSVTTLSDKQSYEKTSKLESFINSSLCLDGKFDAISVLSDNHTYIFKNDYVYRISNIFGYKEFL